MEPHELLDRRSHTLGIIHELDEGSPVIGALGEVPHDHRQHAGHRVQTAQEQVEGDAEELLLGQRSTIGTLGGEQSTQQVVFGRPTALAPGARSDRGDLLTRVLGELPGHLRERLDPWHRRR